MTSPRSLHLADGLQLPAEDLLESAIGIIAKRGRGKSGAIKVLMEELTDAGLPFVAFDPVGILWGIRSSFDGTAPGLPVLVIGGQHADVPLDRKAGAAVAARIVAENVSCVVDFSDEPKAAYREFVRDFAHELFRKNDTPRLVILEEAPELVPQRVMGDRADVFEAVERLVSRGRNKGLGVVLVSQRAATINKDVLTQVDALLVMGLAAPQDRKAIGEWIKAWDVEGRAEEFDHGLASLKRQEGWFWSPEAFGGIFLRTKIRDFRTFHPDKTHLRRTGMLKTRPVTADVAGVVARFRGQKSREEKDVDAEERKEFEEKIRALDQKVVRLETERADWERRYNAEHARAEANARTAATETAKRIAATPSFREVARGFSGEDEIRARFRGTPSAREGEVDSRTHGADPTPTIVGPTERVELRVDREAASVTVRTKVVSITATEDDTNGKMAILAAEGFFDQDRKIGDVGPEYLTRGWLTYNPVSKGGGSYSTIRNSLDKLVEWKLLFHPGAQREVYRIVPEAKERIRVVEERVAA